MEDNFGMSNVAQQVGQFASQALGSYLDYKWTKKLTDQQNEYNLDMWHLQNEYNSPKNQMARFREAGLNPNLIYGQGTSGNASVAPQMLAPSPPKVDKAAEALSKAFNIEGLLTARAKRKQEQSNAELAAINTANAKDERRANYDFGSIWVFNTKTGKYERVSDNSVNVYSPLTKEAQKIAERTGSYNNRSYYYHKNMANMYAKTHLIPYREALLTTQRNFLAPQAAMKEFDRRNYKDTYYLDRVKNPLNSIGGLYNALKHYIGW